MKQCPVCKTTYTDESLKFCLADGANLISLSEPAETVQMSFDKNPMRINVPPDSSPTVFALPQTSNQPIKKGVSPIIVAVLVGLLLLLAVGFIGVIGYFSLKPTANEKASVSPTPTAKITPTPDNETVELKEKLANLEKQVQDQKNSKNTTSVETYSTPKPSATTARANSPRDGFLALRSDPSSEIGYRITQIPHGAIVNITSCQGYSYVGKNRGRWCQAGYNGFGGWVFDAFLIF